MLAIVGGTVGYLWLSRAAKATLPDATVDIWFTADPLRASGQNKIAALNAAADAFRTLYPNVELRLQSIASEQYEQQLKQAEQDGTLPVLFERTAQNAELACNAKAIRQLNRQISSEEFRLAAPVSGGICRAWLWASRFVCVKCLRRGHRLRFPAGYRRNAYQPGQSRSQGRDEGVVFTRL